VQVDGEGFIFIPYAGKLQAAGQTPDGLRQLITSKLDAQTPDPQVTVQRVAGDGQTVSVAGSVGAQGIYPIERPTRTLSAMIARAGGVAIEPSVAVVRVTRGSQTGQVWMQDLFANPNLDIALRGGDQIVVERDQRAYTALGATGAQSLVPFESQSLSALESLAQVGGLSTTLADPTGVFILRSESASVANAIMGRDDLRGSQRMVYALDLTAPDGLFEARDFQVRDGDTIFVTEAPFSQWTKAVNAVTGTAGAADSLTSIGSSD
jgi:polysaccharide export outer membrane protein